MQIYVAKQSDAMNLYMNSIMMNKGRAVMKGERTGESCNMNDVGASTRPGQKDFWLVAGNVWSAVAGSLQTPARCCDIVLCQAKLTISLDR